VTLRRDRNRLIDEYLDRFDNASVFLAPDRREELRQEIVEHMDAGLEEADAQHAEAVRAVLERLGPPADIVAAELGGPRSTGSTPVVAQPLFAAGSEREHGADHMPSPGTPPPVPPLPPTAPAVTTRGGRKRVILLAGAAVAAFALGTMAIGLTTSDDSGPLQQSPSVQEVPTSMPPPSEAPGSEEPSQSPPPTDGQATPSESVPPSDEPSEPVTDHSPGS